MRGTSTVFDSNIDYYEKKFQHFKPIKHFYARIQEMEKKSNYGAKVASKWREIVNEVLENEVYPVVHPIGRETFSLYTELPTGIFEYALDIDCATSLIKENSIKSLTFNPHDIIDSVDEGNINKDTSNIKTNHKNAVMVLQSQYLTNEKPYCINGNHRIFEAYRKNEIQIEVYVFRDLEFVPFFYDILSKAVYFLEIDYNNVIYNERNLLDEGHSSFAHIFNK